MVSIQLSINLKTYYIFMTILWLIRMTNQELIVLAIIIKNSKGIDICTSTCVFSHAYTHWNNFVNEKNNYVNNICTYVCMYM